MKATRKLVVVGLPLLLSAFATVQAGFTQSVDTDREDEAIASARADSADGDEASRHDPIAFALKRLARLKSELAITAEQEPQWSAFSASVMHQMERMQAAHQSKKPNAETAPQRIDRQLTWMKERTTGYEAMGEAAKELYAALSPEQQQIADEKLMRWHARRGS